MSIQTTGENFHYCAEHFEIKGYKDFYNKRLKIEDFRGNMEEILYRMEKLAAEKYVEKIIVKTRKEALQFLIKQGYRLEAFIPGYFLGSDAYFLCKYKSQPRSTSEKWMEEDEILADVWNKQRKKAVPLEEPLLLRKAEETDAENLSDFYKSVFPIYPVPICDPLYVKAQIQGDAIFHIVEAEGEIVAAASAEINRQYKNAEITDCATLPSHRKAGYMNYIIRNLERELVKKQIYCSYSIARALSFGMNAVLHNLHYTYTGRLQNNCFIYDNIEDMNVWSKDLSLHYAKNTAVDAGN